MRKFQLKVVPTVDVLGNTFEGDYIVFNAVENGADLVRVVAKADFDAEYEAVPDPAPVATPAPAPAVEAAPAAHEATSPNAAPAV